MPIFEWKRFSVRAICNKKMNPTPNLAARLSEMARQYHDHRAVVEPLQSGQNTAGGYRTMTFAELDADTDRIAAALMADGVKPGMKLALFVRYGIDFIALVFALCKAGVTIVLIDPGMGIRRMLDCLAEVEPDGFVAVPAVQAARTVLKLLKRKSFPKARFNVTVGRRWFWGGSTLAQMRRRPCPADFKMIQPGPDDWAAIIFTSGSTGPPKGVAFTHTMFNTQVEQIAKRYEIKPGEIDLACFPFFGLFDALMGVTAIIPDMDTSRPATVDPKKIVDAAEHWQITQAFASPALWNRVTEYCQTTGRRMTTLRRAVSAGAPVSATILEKLQNGIHPDGDVFTPYGATEALPTASISAREVLGETVSRTKTGGGVCVGQKFVTINWRVIEISDDPIARLEDAKEMPTGEIGELAVTGPQVTQIYVNRPEATAAAKMRDAEGQIWHRMGDVGYLDEQERFWFCGRKAHRVVTAERTFFSIPCEAIFNQHPKIFRSALAGSPNGSGPRMFIEPKPGEFPVTREAKQKLLEELRELGRKNPLTEAIHDIRLLRNFPVDVRHNVKIDREKLTEMK